jgi:hypothetical protein
MRTFLISYDLAHPNRNKHVLATAIMSLGQSWARPLEQTWYVRAETSEGDIEKRLAGLLDGDDGLIVQAVSDDAQLTNTSLRWFRQRRTPFDIEASTNVIAFPLPGVVPAQAELPLAQAS